MSAKLPALAMAVAEAINAHGGWSSTFTAERVWQPIYDVREMGSEIKVSVVGTKIESARSARKLWEQVYTVEIGVQHRPGELTEAELDTLARCAEEIAEFWEDQTEVNAGGSRFTLMGVSTDYVNFEQLEELRQFTSVVVLSFKAWR